MLPKVWAVAAVEAATIALAEIDRWAPFIDDGQMVGKLTTAVLAGYKLAEAGYKSQPELMVATCLAACDTD